VAGTWTQYYGHQDRLGSVHKLVDGTGAVVDTYGYGPYGGLTSGGSATDNPYLWTGRRYDQETGLYYFRNRYYSPGIGRFLTEDPLGVWADIAHFGNPYAYAGNSPTNFFDPFGLQTGVAVVAAPSLLELAASAVAAIASAPVAVGVVALAVASTIAAGAVPRPEHAAGGPRPQWQGVRGGISCTAGVSPPFLPPGVDPRTLSVRDSLRFPPPPPLSIKDAFDTDGGPDPADAGETEDYIGRSRETIQDEIDALEDKIEEITEASRRQQQAGGIGEGYDVTKSLDQLRRLYEELGGK